MSIEELQNAMQMAAAQVKLSTGIGNNAAWAACLEAHDHIKRHRNYRNRVKQAYKLALDEFKSYERGLLYADKNRMFRMSDMTAKTRKIYGDITDRDYYDFWAGIGASAYRDARPLVTSLVNKYRLSLLNHDIQQADILAWPLAAMACLEIARQIYEVTLQIVIETHGLPRRIVDEVFCQFSLSRVNSCWRRALELTEPKSIHYELDPMEDRNITLGIEQLQDKWCNTSEHLSTTAKTMLEYDDVFRTKGEMKKAIRQIDELMQDIEESTTPC